MVIAVVVFLIIRSHGQNTRVEPVGGAERSERPVRQSVFDANSARPTAQKLQIKGAAYVVDGDTIIIRNTQVRLFGIDAPELDHPYGKTAKSAMVALCKGQTVIAEILETDAHGRTVAKCWLPDGRDLSAELVKQGLALDWKKFSGGIYRQLETPNARKKLWLADARQKGRMHVWENFEARRRNAPIASTGSDPQRPVLASPETGGTET